MKASNQFYIQLKDGVVRDNGAEFLIGEIRILGFVERFHASIVYWNRDGYLAQWREGLERIVQGHASSCLVTSMYHPDYANYIFWWVMYREDNLVHIQNQILFLNELNRPFREEEIYSYIRERESVSADGTQISEWSIAIEEIELFVASWSKS